jgi:hypothetical protein
MKRRTGPFAPDGGTSPPRRSRARRSAGVAASACAFTFFPRDCLGWSMWPYLSQSQKGDLFELIACAAENGTGTIPADHPVLARIDPTVAKHALVRKGDVVAVVQPLNVSLASERFQRVHPGCAPRRCPAGQQSHTDEQQRDGDERRRVVWLHFIEERSQHPRKH